MPQLSQSVLFIHCLPVDDKQISVFTSTYLLSVYSNQILLSISSSNAITSMKFFCGGKDLDSLFDPVSVSLSPITSFPSPPLIC